MIEYKSKPPIFLRETKLNLIELIKSREHYAKIVIPNYNLIKIIGAI